MSEPIGSKIYEEYCQRCGQELFSSGHRCNVPAPAEGAAKLENHIRFFHEGCGGILLGTIPGPYSCAECGKHIDLACKVLGPERIEVPSAAPADPAPLVACFTFPWTVSLHIDEEGDTIAKFTDAPPNVRLMAHGKDAHEALTILSEIVKTYKEMLAEEAGTPAPEGRVHAYYCPARRLEVDDHRCTCGLTREKPDLRSCRSCGEGTTFTLRIQDDPWTYECGVCHTLIGDWPWPGAAQPAPPEQPPVTGQFRVGGKVPLNVYEGDRPVFQCHTPEEAARFVALLNAGLDKRQAAPRVTREQRMAAEGITEEDIAETMPPKPEDAR